VTQRTSTRAQALGAALALAAALHKLLRAAVPVNDDFMHLTYSRQLLAGEWPVRDFFDYGMGLMYALSAAAQLAFGYRLLSEAIVVAVMVGISTFFVYDIGRRATGSIVAAVLAALLLVVAVPRGYAYPKWIVYAVAASLWWRYVWEPSRGKALGLGLWTAVAYYWRPDHGAYVAVGVVAAMLAAHGVSAVAVTRCLQSGAVAIAIVAPSVLYASAQNGGVAAFVRGGITAAFEEHRGTGQAIPRWPVYRPSGLLSVDPARKYAPTIDIRWTEDSSAASRAEVLQQYGLTTVFIRNDVTQTVQLSERAVRELRSLMAQPIVEDTDGVDRTSGRVSSSAWPASQRWRFSQWWLRVNVLPGLDEQVAAGEAATILLVALPLIALCASLTSGAYLPARVGRLSLALFAAFTLVVDVGLLRTPFNVRAGEAVALPAIVLALLMAALLQMSRIHLGWRRWSARTVAAIVVLLVLKSLVVAGQSGERLRWLAGDGSVERARIAWGDASSRLGSTPPIEHWRERGGSARRLAAAYAHDCLSPSDRILVTWFAPDIYYYADRLMAGRHLYFHPLLGALPHERTRELEKLARSPAQMVFAKAMADNPAERVFPDLVERFAREYVAGGVIDDNGERYSILVRKDRVPVRTYGDAEWPCYR
jgi:hypothetical protein